jgi:cytochrome c biogenesis protein CcmG/thiol:disulfide interchange protein DsbE
MKKAYLIGAAVVAVILLALGCLYLKYEEHLPANRNPKLFSVLDQMEKSGVPDFTIAKLDGSGDVSLASLKGQVLVINFWASWCNPCVEEFPSLLNLSKAFAKDVKVVAISTDENRDDAKAFVQTLGVMPPGVLVLWDPQRKLADAYGVEKIPESYIVGRDLRLLRKVMGVDDWATKNAQAFFTDLIHGATH